MIRIANPQDAGAGLLFILIGAIVLVAGREYDVGTLVEMGPGFIPDALAILLVIFGLIIGLRGLRIRGPAVEMVRWRPLLCILAALTVFAVLIQTAGLAPSIFVSTIVAAAATEEFRWRWALGLATGLTVLCVVVFVYALRQPIPVFGATG